MWMCAWMYVWMYVWMCVWMYVWMWMCAYMHIPRCANTLLHVPHTAPVFLPLYTHIHILLFPQKTYRASLQERFTALQHEYDKAVRVSEVSRQVSKENIGKAARMQRAARQVGVFWVCWVYGVWVCCGGFGVVGGWVGGSMRARRTASLVSFSLSTQAACVCMHTHVQPTSTHPSQSHPHMHAIQPTPSGGTRTIPDPYTTRQCAGCQSTAATSKCDAL